MPIDIQLAWELVRRTPVDQRTAVLELLVPDEAMREQVRELVGDEPPPEAHNPTGPQFEIIEEIGAGAQARVVRARRVDLARECALKLYEGNLGDAFRERVRAEARAMARVHSPYVVTIFDAGLMAGAKGTFFVEMSLCADPSPDGDGLTIGTTLQKRVDTTGKALPPLEAARVIEQVCRGVDAAHQADVVHGDIKPSNILITPREQRAMLTDFGLARVERDIAIRANAGAGTVLYMAPEQYPNGSSTRSSDIYALGGTLYYALTGEAPHVERQTQRDREPLARRLPSTIPRSVREILGKAVAPKPEERWGRASEMADALRAYQQSLPTSLEARRPARRFAIWLSRNRGQVVGAFFVLVALGFGVTLGRTWIEKTGLEGEKDKLKTEKDKLVGEKDKLDSELQLSKGRLSGLEDEVSKKKAELGRMEQIQQDNAVLKVENSKLREAEKKAIRAQGEAETTLADARTSSGEREKKLQSDVVEERQRLDAFLPDAGALIAHAIDQGMTTLLPKAEERFTKSLSSVETLEQRNNELQLKVTKLESERQHELQCATMIKEFTKYRVACSPQPPPSGGTSETNGSGTGDDAGAP